MAKVIIIEDGKTQEFETTRNIAALVRMLMSLPADLESLDKALAVDLASLARSRPAPGEAPLS